jgi:hypothetical protein
MKQPEQSREEARPSAQEIVQPQGNDQMLAALIAAMNAYNDRGGMRG